MLRTTLLLTAVCGIAAGAVAALLGTLGALPNSDVRFPVHSLQIVGFCGVAAPLLADTRRDPRAADLGTVMALFAWSFALPSKRASHRFCFSVGPVIDVLLHFPADALLALYSWRFLREFPGALQSGTSRTIGKLGVVASAAAAIVLLVANALRLVPALAESPALALFSRANQTSQYWTISYGFLLPALAYAFANVRHARVEERRRVSWFLAGMIAAGVPVNAFIVAGALSPEFAAFVRSPRGQTTLLPLVQLLILSLPVMTAYAVLVRHVLDVRLVIRKALQYGLARSLVTLAVAAPFAWVGWRLFALRGEPIAALAEGLRPVALGVPLAAGIIALRLRRPAIRALDRLFFREQADARELLSALGEKAAAARDARELAELLTHEIDRALHLRTCALLIADPVRAELATRAGVARSLPLASGLAQLVTTSRSPLALELEAPSPAVASLALEDRQWIADGAFALLVPLSGSEGALLGCIALGEKRSELPFSRDDRLLLSAIAAAASLNLETRLLREATGTSSVPVRDDPARECARCGAVWEPSARACEACAGELVAASVPYLLAGKFRVERRLGRGRNGSRLSRT